MCRFTFYMGADISLASLITEPENSLIHQSFDAHEREEPLNGDGFGLAWYAPDHDEPALFKSVTPAWSNRNLRDLARVIRSRCVMGHVRAATQALEVSEANCHPFRRGRHLFMHNGDIGGFDRLRRPIVDALSDRAFGALHGSTDSEYFFGLLMDSIREMDVHDVTTLAEAVQRTLRHVLTLSREHGVDEHTYLNAVITDGARAVACRFTTDVRENADSLYLATGRGFRCRDGVCSLVHDTGEVDAVLVSSEPLSGHEAWTSVPVNHMVLVASDLSTRTLAMEV